MGRPIPLNSFKLIPLNSFKFLKIPLNSLKHQFTTCLGTSNSLKFLKIPAAQLRPGRTVFQIVAE